MTDPADNPYRAPGATLEPEPVSGDGLPSRWSPDQFRKLLRIYSLLHWIGLAVYLVGIALYIGAVVLMVSGALRSGRSPDPDRINEQMAGFLGMLIPGFLGMMAGFGLWIASVVIAAILGYRLWTLVQRPGLETTPGQAVGFQFIPFFNFYWVFVAWRGLAVELRRRGGNAPVGLATAAGVLFILNCIPYLNLLALLPFAIVVPFMVRGLVLSALPLLRRPA
jgi:hypothetical protein